MADINQNYSALLTLIRDLSNEHIPSEYSDVSEAVAMVRELTKSIWDTKYYDLLTDLDNLSNNTFHDVQQFWFECLIYPYSFPIRKNAQGESISKKYYYLPSNFNDIEFHDSKVISVKIESDIEIILAHIEDWNEDKSGWNQTGREKKLVFKNGAIQAFTYQQDKTKTQVDISSIDFPKSDILDFWELPAIKYFQSREGITCDLRKRLFKMESTADGYSEIIVISDDWQIETISNEIHDINYAFKVNN